MKKSEDLNSTEEINTSKEIDTVLVKAIQRIENLRNGLEDISGVPTGFPSLDRITYGWQSTDLIILAARPSVGKTAFALNLARHAAMDSTKSTSVGYFSLEMNSNQLVQRILSAESEIWLEKIARGKLEEHEMKQLYKNGIERLSKAPMFIDDTARLNINDLKIKSKNLKENHNIGLIIIDYLQLMTGIDGDSNREQELSKISRELKILAKELEVPIIALSQLSREVEKRREGAKIPQLNDLRDSGAIEENADLVIFLYRPEYYDIDVNEFGLGSKGETYVKIAKHRNGSLDTVKLKALLHIQKFIEEEVDSDFMSGLQGNNWKPTINQTGAKLYINKGTKMNEAEFDDDAPF